MLKLRNVLTPIVLVAAISLLPINLATAQSLDAGWWTQINVRECGPPRTNEIYPDCGDVQSELRNTDTDLGVAGSASSSFHRAIPRSRSAASAGYTGAGFAPAISAYSYSALGDRIIASAFGLQRYEFVADGEVSGSATITYSQTGLQAGDNPLRSRSSFLLSGIIVFQTENDLFEPANCGVDDLTSGVAMLNCLIREAQSQEDNPPGEIYDGALEFVNTEFDDLSSPQNNASEVIQFSFSGEAGDVFFLTADLFIFANNGAFGNSRATLMIELDNPDLVQAAFPVETFVAAPQPVDADIRPFSRKNKIWLRPWGVIPVAVLGSPEFDALQVLIPTVRFGPDQAKAIHWPRYAGDINHDGFSDLVLLFRTLETGIACGDTEATLSGGTHSGDSFTGIDILETVGCH